MAVNLDDLLSAFREGRGTQVWPDFLDHAGGVLLQVARSVARDEDEAGDAFVFVCDGLAARDFARLRKFDPAGVANPLTWLRAVGRNLCLDHQRALRGRFRVFESIARLPLVDQLVFRRRYRDRLSLAETFAVLGAEIPGLTLDAVVAADLRVSVNLSSRQIWTLAASRPQFESLTASENPDAPPALEPAATDPDPEALLASAEMRERLLAATAALPAEDQLLIRLRLEQDLTLAEVARVCGLRDAQQADRRLRAIYAALRQRLA